MADFAAQITEARKSGHSDDDIIGFLSSRPDLSSKIQQARTAGYSPADILGHLSSAHPVVQTVEHPGFFQAAWNSMSALPGSIWHDLTSTGISDFYNEMKPGGGMSATPEERALALAHAKTRAITPALGDKRGHGLLPQENEYIPTIAEMTGGLTGQAVGMAALTALTEGLESPRLRGYIGGALRATPKAAKKAALTGVGAALGGGHGQPGLGTLMEGASAIQATPALLGGAREGAKGKLWLGPVAREIRDQLTGLPEKPASWSGGSETPGLSNASQFNVAPRPLTIDELSAGQSFRNPPALPEPWQVENRFVDLPRAKPITSITPARAAMPALLEESEPWVPRVPAGAPVYKPPGLSPDELLAKISASAPASVIDGLVDKRATLLDDLSRAQLGKRFKSATADEQVSINRLADKIEPPTAAPAPAALPGAAAPASLPASSPVRPFVNDRDSQIMAPAVAPPPVKSMAIERPMVPLASAPAELPQLLKTRYQEVGGKHSDIRALNTHNKNADIAQHLHDLGHTTTAALSDDAINAFIKDVNANTGNAYKPLGAGSKGKGEGRTAAQQRADIDLYLQHIRGELK